MNPAGRSILLVVLLLVAALILRLPDTEFGSPHRPVTEPPIATPSATPPLLSAKAADRQDRVDDAHRRRETRAFDDRPLLAVLPVTLGGVRIAIEGLSADGVTTELSISAGSRGREYAEAVYRRALVAFGDSGDAYAVRWSP